MFGRRFKSTVASFNAREPALFLMKRHCLARRRADKRSSGPAPRKTAFLLSMLVTFIGIGPILHGSQIGAQYSSLQFLAAKQSARVGPTDSATPLISVSGARNGLVLTPGQKSKLKVQVTDRAGKPLSDVGVLLVAPEFGASGTFKGAQPKGAAFIRTRTDGNGNASAKVIANNTRGVYLLDAIVEGVEAATTFAVTNVAADVNPALAPDQARLAVKHQLLFDTVEDETLLLHGPVLLEAGTLVASGGPGSTFFPTTPFTTTKLMWLFWVDENPLALFAHPTRFVLLDASDSAPDLTNKARVTREDWWPVVTLPGASETAALLPPLNSTVTPALAASTVDSAKRESPAVDAPTDACAIVIYGPNVTTAFDAVDVGKKDANNVKKFLIDNKLVPASNVYTSGDAQTPPTSTNAPATIDDLERLLNLAKSNGCKKLYLYINAHGARRLRLNVEAGGGGTLISGGFDLKEKGTNDTDIVRFSDFALLLKPLKGMELCVIQDTCFSGELCEWLQGAGFTGTFVSSADRDHTSLYNGFGSAFTNALLKCWGDPKADLNNDGNVTLEEAYKWTIANSDEDVTGSKPKESAINPLAPNVYPLEDLVIPRDGSVNVVVKRPESVPLSSVFKATITITDSSVASVDSTANVTLQPGQESATLPVKISGNRNGSTSYTIEGRDTTTGQAFSGQALIQVGGFYSVKPDPLIIKKGDRMTAFLSRFGPLVQTPRDVTLKIKSRDESIAKPVNDTITLPRLSEERDFDVQGLADGETTIDVIDEVYGFRTSFKVIVTSQVARVDELKTDDGTPENFVLLNNLMFVNRLTPVSYPSTLQTIRIDFGQIPNQPSPIGQQIRLIAFQDPSGSGRPPNNPAFVVNQMVTIPHLGFVDFPVNGPTINSGDIYVGYQLGNPVGGVGFFFDTDMPTQVRAFGSTNGGVTFSSLQPPADKFNFMTRALVLEAQ